MAWMTPQANPVVCVFVVQHFFSSPLTIEVPTCSYSSSHSVIDAQKKEKNSSCAVKYNLSLNAYRDVTKTIKLWKDVTDCWCVWWVYVSRLACFANLPAKPNIWHVNQTTVSFHTDQGVMYLPLNHLEVVDYIAITVSHKNWEKTNTGQCTPESDDCSGLYMHIREKQSDTCNLSFASVTVTLACLHNFCIFFLFCLYFSFIVYLSVR